MMLEVKTTGFMQVLLECCAALLVCIPLAVFTGWCSWAKGAFGGTGKGVYPCQLLESCIIQIGHRTSASNWLTKKRIAPLLYVVRWVANSWWISSRSYFVAHFHQCRSGNILLLSCYWLSLALICGSPSRLKMANPSFFSLLFLGTSFQGLDKYEDWKYDRFSTLAEFLNDFPALKVTASFILSQLPLLQPVRKVLAYCNSSLWYPWVY